MGISTDYRCADNCEPIQWELPFLYFSYSRNLVRSPIGRTMLGFPKISEMEYLAQYVSLEMHAVMKITIVFQVDQHIHFNLSIFHQ